MTEHSIGAYRQEDPETSKAVDGLTCYEIAAALRMSLRPLVRKGFVYDSGERRETPTGRRAIIWKLTRSLPKTQEDV